MKRDNELRVGVNLVGGVYRISESRIIELACRN
jgi:hypothetical protein